MLVEKPSQKQTDADIVQKNFANLKNRVETNIKRHGGPYDVKFQMVKEDQIETEEMEEGALEKDNLQDEQTIEILPPSKEKTLEPEPVEHEPVESKEAKAEDLKKDIDQTFEQKKPTQEELEKGYIVGKENQLPPLKPEGETYTIEINGVTKTYEIKGPLSETVFGAKDITTGETTKIDSVLIEGAAKTSRENLREDYRVRFGFDEKDINKLETNPDYAKLSVGQKRFVLENLTATTLESVDEIAGDRFNQELATKGRVGKFFNRFFSESKMAGVKKRAFDDLRSGGLERHKGTIDALIARVQIMDTPMVENEKGEIEIQYSSKFKDMMVKGELPETAREVAKAQRAFNQAATRLQHIPPEWESQSATKSQRNAARAAKELYDAEKMRCMGYFEKHDYENTGKFFGTMSDIDNKVELNRVMNAHPDNEMVLNNLYRDSKGKVLDSVMRAGKDVFVKEHRGYYAAAGWGARGATQYFDVINFASAGAISGIIGAFRGVAKGRKMIRENEAAMRRGAENKLGKKENESKLGSIINSHMDVKMTELRDNKEEGGRKGYLEKVNDISEKIKAASLAGDTKGVELFTAMLNNRVRDTIEKAKAGKISFGNKSERLANQMMLLGKIRESEAYAAAGNPEAKKGYEQRMNALMDMSYGKQDLAEKKARMKFISKHAAKNAALGALFGGAGYAARHGYEALKESGIMGETWDWIKNSVGEIKDSMGVSHAAAGAAAVGHVPTDAGIPRVGKLHGGKDISEFFGKDDTNISPHDAIAGQAASEINAGPDSVGIEGIHQDVAESTYVQMDEPSAIPEAPHSEYIVKPQTVEFSSKGSIDTIRQLKAKLITDYKGIDPDKIPASVKEIMNGDPTKLAMKFGFFKPGEINESAMVMKGSTLSIDSAGNIDYHHVGENSYHILETSDGKQSYRYGEKMFDYDAHNSGGNKDEYIIKNGQKVPVINHPSLDEAKAQVEAANSAEKDAADGKWMQAQPETDFTAQNAARYSDAEHTPKAKVGKSLNEPFRPRRTGFGPYETTAGTFYTGDGPYQTANATGNPHYAYDGMYQREGGINQPGGFDLPRSHAFDGAVNRQYNNLIEDTFGGQRDIITGDKTIDRNIQNMLDHHLAEDDINAVAAEDAGENMKKYLSIVDQIHKVSGLEPREGEPTGIYLKEALQSMKNNGVNIRQFRKALEKFLEDSYGDTPVESTPENSGSDFDMEPVKPKKEQIIDDVYR